MSLLRRRKPVPVTPPPVAPVAASPVVAVINHSTVLTDAQLAPIIAALQVQCDRDFGPLWNTTATIAQVPRGSQPPIGAWQMFVMDDTTQAGALGYHDFTPEGKPVAYIFAKTDLQHGLSVSVTMSHELLEMLADAGCDLCAQADNDTFVAFEACDPCEDDSDGYQINGVLVSDFVTPEYFMPQPPASAKFDFMDKLPSPFSISSGGYLSIWTPSTGWGTTVNGEVKRPVKARGLRQA